MVLKHGNSEDCGRKAFSIKIFLGCTAGLILDAVHVFAASMLASGYTVRGMSERGPAVNPRLHQIQN